jgi:hypothetical protein
MRSKLAILAAAGVAAAMGAASAKADPGVGYRLELGNTMVKRYCLPPCLCPYTDRTGALAGTFTLTRTGVDAQYENYTVTGLEFTTTVNGEQYQLEGYGSYRRSTPAALEQELVLELRVNGVAEHFDSGLVAIDPQHPFPQIAIATMTAVAACRQDVLNLVATPDPTVCYANCDGSTTVPALNVADFTCFLQRFSSGDPYANCDGSTASPVLNIADFTCFLQAFSLGCTAP